jgi:glycosyltransferase involved in cell wall biosynthesis
VPRVPLAKGERLRLREQLGLAGAVVIGDFSPFSWSKRPELLLAALGAAGPGARLLLVGGVHADPGIRRRFFDRAAAGGLAGRVVEAGELAPDGLSRMLSLVDVYVHTGTQGASSRSTTLVAALGHGLPVAAFQGPETPDYFDSSSMELVPEGQDVLLLDAIASLVASPERRALLAGGAARLHRERLDWDRIALEFMEAAA